MMLDPILENTRRRVEAMGPAAEYRARALDAPPVRDFASGLKTPGLGVIAEVKRRSPSRGDLAVELDPADQARRYDAGGAVAISVLTEPHHFLGSDADLTAVRTASRLPVLRKDFTLDPRQIWEARAIGADAVLLIVAALDQPTLIRLHEEASEAGVAALVEVHDRAETERALALGAGIVGVNNRNLHTFEVDLATAEELAPLLVEVPITVAESGVFTAADARRMAQAGFDAVLVGEALVRADDPAGLIRSFGA